MAHDRDWPNTCLLVGAGFTYELGMPLVGELTGELKAWLTPDKLRELNAGWRAQRGGHRDENIEFLAGLLIRPELHYEQIIGALDERFRVGSDQDCHGLAAWVTEIVAYILYFRHSLNGERILTNSRFYRGLTSLAKLASPLWIFSLNHDVCVEVIAHHFGIPWSNGFGSSEVSFPLTNAGVGAARRLVFNRISQEELASLRFRFGSEGVNLVKLHGGLEFFTHADRTEYLVLKEAPSAQGLIESLRALYEGSSFEDSGGRFKATNEFVVSNDHGQAQFLRHTLLSGTHKFSDRANQEAPKELLDLFTQQLDGKNALVSIGYGFGDQHINEIVVGWLRGALLRRLVIVDPRRTQLPDCLTEIGAQVEVRTEAAVDFLDNAGHVARDARETLELRLLRCVRRVPKDERDAAFDDARKKHIEYVGRVLIPKIVSEVGPSDAATIVAKVSARITLDDVLKFLIEHIEARTPEAAPSLPESNTSTLDGTACGARHLPGGLGV